MDEPVISYYVHEGNEQGQVRIAIKSGETWAIESIDNLTNVQLGFTGARNLTALEIDKQDLIHVTYGDRKIVKYARGAIGNWEIETVVDESTTNKILGQQQDIALDNTSTPHITYFEVTYENRFSERGIGVRRYRIRR